MKKLFLSLFLLILFLLITGCDGNITLINNEKSDYIIIYGENSSPSEKTAAKEMQNYLKRISGFKIDLKTDAEPLSDKEIIIGKTNREGNGYTIDREKLGKEGFDIKTVNQSLIIAGGEERGTLYGVYTFLEEILGCRWFTSKVNVIPELKTVTVPDSINIEQIPVLENRDVFWGTSWDMNWSVAQKVNGLVNRSITESFGGGISYAGQFVHTFNVLVPPDEYFGTHPEYYALNENGERQTSQLCLTNPDVLEIVINKVKQWFDENPAATIISVSQNDTGGQCRCDNCKAIDEEEGSSSGSLLRFVNAVADTIKDEYPGKAIDTLAYNYTRKAPKITKPRENVIIRLCSIEACFSHPLAECNATVNNFAAGMSDQSFLKDLEDWGKICNRLYIWDYTTNFRYYLAPFPNFNVLAPNIQTFVENNVKGVFEQGNYQDTENGEFGELRAYLLAKLLWDPYTDINKHMNEFLAAYYGKGWENIRKYIDLTLERGKEKHFGIYEVPIKMLSLSKDDIAQCDAWWDAAVEAEKDNKAVVTRIERSRLQLDFYKFSVDYGDYENRSKRNEEMKNYYKKLLLYDISQINEGKSTAEEPNYAGSILDW